MEFAIISNNNLLAMTRRLDKIQHYRDPWLVKRGMGILIEKKLRASYGTKLVLGMLRRFPPLKG